MNFSQAIFYENYLTSDFHTNTVISRRLPTGQNGVENRDKAYFLCNRAVQNGKSEVPPEVVRFLWKISLCSENSGLIESTSVFICLSVLLGFRTRQTIKFVKQSSQ